MKRTVLLLLATLISLAFRLPAQSLADTEAKAYFGNLKTNHDQTNLSFSSLPSLADCKRVFVGENAQVYFDFMTAKTREWQAKAPDPIKTYADVGVKTCTTQDILDGKGNYPGGMDLIKDKLQPNLLMAKVKLLENVGDVFGLSTSMWIKLDDKWFFFPKPWEAFEAK